MILGFVLDLTPRVKLTLRGQSSAVTLDFVVDTGFEGEIALPRDIIAKVNAAYAGPQTIRLADGTFGKESRYIATIQWDGDNREVEILSLRTGVALLGVELLADNRLTIDLADGGEVSIEPL